MHPGLITGLVSQSTDLCQLLTCGFAAPSSRHKGSKLRSAYDTFFVPVRTVLHTTRLCIGYPRLGKAVCDVAHMAFSQTFATNANVWGKPARGIQSPSANMRKQLRTISINFPFESQGVVVVDTLATKRAFFDFDVVVIRPPQFNQVQSTYAEYEWLESVMSTKKGELMRLFGQGGLLVVILDVPSTYRVRTSSYTYHRTYSVNNYEFLECDFINCLRSGVGEQISYSDHAEPFVAVLKGSTVAWTTYVASVPPHPFNELKFFAWAGAGTAVAGKMPYGEGHFIVLPNLKRLDEALFFEACAEYRYKRQGSKPPDWLTLVLLPGLSLIESQIAVLEAQISDLQAAGEQQRQQMEVLSAYRKLLYEKGKALLEPIARRALDDLGFGATPGEVIKGTNYEIDGRTAEGSVPGIVEVKGSRKQIALDELSPFVVKILADHEATKSVSKGILVGNGLCENGPDTRLGDVVFSPHVLDGSKRNSIALINSVELYWLCCTLLGGAELDKSSIRETILKGSGYIDLKPFCGKSPW
jgi:hypothetical protein